MIGDAEGRNQPGLIHAGLQSRALAQSISA
jgi:hypothetical protein